MGIGGSSSSSKPVDMTPTAFRNLQGPFASVFASLLGFGPPGGPSNGTGWVPSGVSSGRKGTGVKYTYNPGGGAVNTSPTPTSAQFAGTGGSVGRTGASIGRPGGQIGANAGHLSGTGGGLNFMNGKDGGQPQPAAPLPTNPSTGDPNQILSGIPKYPGQITSEIGANEQALLDMLMQQTGGGAGGTTAGPTQGAQDYLAKVMAGDFMPGGASTGGLSAFTQMLQDSRQTSGYNSNEINPFLNAAIEAAQRPTLQGLEETLSRTLPGRFTEAGQFKQPGGSSAFDRAGALATRSASDALADIATNLSFQSLEAERGRQFEAQEGARQREDAQMSSELERIFGGRENERNRQNEAAGLTSTLQSQEVDNMVKNLQAQALPRLINEYGIERGIEQFNNQVNTLLAVLGIAQGVTAPTIGQQQESSSMQASLPLK